MAKTKARTEPAKRASAKRATRTTTGRRTAAKTAPAKSSRSSETGKPPTKQATKPAAKPAAKSDKTVTREDALATIRALVEAKKQRARQPPPWPGADPHQHRAHETLEPPPGDEARAESQIEERERSDPEENIGHRKGGFRGIG